MASPLLYLCLETETRNVRTISFENVGFDSFKEPGVYIRAQTVHLMADEFSETIGLLEKVGWRIEIDRSSIISLLLIT